MGRSRETTDWSTALYRLREHMGLTQEGLARMLEVTVSTVNRWENGHSQPTPMARKAVRALASQNDFRMPENLGL